MLTLNFDMYCWVKSVTFLLKILCFSFPPECSRSAKSPNVNVMCLFIEEFFWISFFKTWTILPLKVFSLIKLWVNIVHVLNFRPQKHQIFFFSIIFPLFQNMFFLYILLTWRGKKLNFFFTVSTKIFTFSLLFQNYFFLSLF